ncbi:MAG: hypothetical protein IRY97_12595 [Thermomicrobiaceae bacterium]|nr:hypothetical protein [Thermomicrobiaceae bacterium]
MTETHPIRLSPGEVIDRARKFFGPGGLGLREVASEPERLRFEGPKGFVEVLARPSTNNQVRLTLEYDGYEHDAKEFRARLARQGQAETRAG